MGIITSLIGSVVTFVVGLLVGGVGIYAGARLVVGKGDFWTAVWTAVFGALGWVVVALLFGWIPFLGGLIETVLGLAVYLVIVSVQYDVDWTEAAAISVVAWVAVLVATFFLGSLLGPRGVVGVPFA
jgi:hypothetical protein